jgi:formate dehydrogenase major subunit
VGKSGVSSPVHSSFSSSHHTNFFRSLHVPNGRLQRSALAKLKWLVVRDMVEVETASFWYDSPEVDRGEMNAKDISTEVFLFPAAGTAEKAGTFTNTQRMLQYRDQAIEPPGDARSEAWFLYHLGRRLKDKAKRDPRPRNAALNALTWDYPVHGKLAEPEIEAALREINGHTVADGSLLPTFRELKNDGSTACGCWIYCGVFPSPGENRAKQRDAKGVSRPRLGLRLAQPTAGFCPITNSPPTFPSSISYQ